MHRDLRMTARVSLRLVKPIHWTRAVKLIAEFSKTHLTTTHKGELVLRGRYGGCQA